MATADQLARQSSQERRVMYSSVPGGGLTSFILGDGQRVSATQFEKEMYFNFYNQYPALQKYNQQFVLEVARESVRQNSYATLGQMSVIASKYGIDPYSLFKQSTSTGGSGVNRANAVRSLTAVISDIANQFGIPFTPEQIGALATTAEKQNWSETQIVDELTKNVNWYRLNSGTIKTNYEDYKTIGRNFLVNLSDKSAQDWALKVAKGELTQETVMQNIKEAAKIANPWLADYIDRGLNPLDVLAPNRDFIANSLEINPEDLDLLNPKDMAMITVTDPNGDRRLANQVEMTKIVRNDTRWKNTNNAKELTAGMGSLLSQVFGRSVF